LWEVGADYTEGLAELLQRLLQSVTWQDALARACAEILEGTWATKYVGVPTADAPPFWPSQRQGIAQALWVLEHVGSVLVADATGSGKTRMGAYLIAALMQRFLLGEGRARADLRPLPIVRLAWWRDGSMTTTKRVSRYTFPLTAYLAPAPRMLANACRATSGEHRFWRSTRRTDS
jgi:hypothetical protein